MEKRRRKILVRKSEWKNALLLPHPAPDSPGLLRNQPPSWWLRHPHGMLKGGEWSPRL